MSGQFHRLRLWWYVRGPLVWGDRRRERIEWAERWARDWELWGSRVGRRL